MHLSFAILRMHYIFFILVVLDTTDSTVDLTERAKGYASLTNFCTKYCPSF